MLEFKLLTAKQLSEIPFKEPNDETIDLEVSRKIGKLLMDVVPYGVYISDDGTQTLFDRGYNPIISRDKNNTNIKKATGWINYSKQEWFYCNDGKNDIEKRGLFLTTVIRDFCKGKPIRKYFIEDEEDCA